MRDSKRLLLALAAAAAAGLAGCLSSPDSGPSAVAEGTQSAAVQTLVGDSLRPIHPLPPVCDSLVGALATLDSISPDYAALRQRMAHVCAVRPPRPDSLPPRPDSLRPPRPACDSLVALRASLDSAVDPAAWSAANRQAQVACALPPVPPRDSLPPQPPRHDSVPPVRPPNPCDTLITYINGLDSSVAPTIRSEALAHLRVCQAGPGPRPDSVIAPPPPVIDSGAPRPVPPAPPRPRPDSVIAPRPPVIDSGAVRPAPVPPRPPVDSTHS